MDLIDSFIGAVVGGLFAIAAIRLSMTWQAEEQARGVSSALLAEMTSANTLGPGPYKKCLDEWEKTGVVRDPKWVVDMFENQPQDSVPVFYSMAGEIDLLPRDVASKVVAYNALMIPAKGDGQATEEAGAPARTRRQRIC